MNKWSAVVLCVLCFLECSGREQFIPREGSLPFVVYYPSRYRGLCVGTLVSRNAVLTAAVCVLSPFSDERDTRPINVVCGTAYRHPRRGIRVQVTKILVSKKITMEHRAYLIEKSTAVLMLKRKIPDVLTEVPLRPLAVDYLGSEVLTLQEECFVAGWHFFSRGDKIYPVHKFLLSRNLRVQFMNIVKANVWCEPLIIKYQQFLSNIGYFGFSATDKFICVRDPDKHSQPCHGMYGASLVCRGKAVGMMTAPDAQWTNCTGYSNIIHLFSSNWLRDFMTCVSSLFVVDTNTEWTAMKNELYEDSSKVDYDYMHKLYGKVYSDLDSSSSE